jgi:glycosyltransferase involved in cell wall biosynthesis
VQRPQILFTATHAAPFILDDLHHLAELGTVRSVIAPVTRSIPRILTALPSTDFTFTWFASMQAVAVVGAARARGKKSVVVIGGVDVAALPGIGYGLWNSRWKGAACGWTIRSAWRVLAVDATLADRARALAAYNGDNIRVVPTGYDTGFWTPEGGKAPVVLTVAGFDDLARFHVKGIPTLLQAARLLPDVRFQLIGPGEHFLPRLRAEAPPNMEIHAAIPRKELRERYRKASVYCQPSLFEGLPNALCEAMLCGCVPVGSAVGGIPGAIGETGFTAPPEDATGLSDALRRALQAAHGGGSERARERIANLFPSAARREALRTLVEEAMA